MFNMAVAINGWKMQAKYLIAVVSMLALGVGAIIAVLLLRPQADALVVIGIIMTFIGPTMGTILTYMKAQETHESVNSQLSEWKREVQTASYEQGRSAGKSEGAQAADARTDQIAEKAKT